MTSTLRTYLEEVQADSNLIEKAVDPKTQIGDLVSQSNKTIVFSNIKGYSGWKDRGMRFRRYTCRHALFHEPWERQIRNTPIYGFG